MAAESSSVSLEETKSVDTNENKQPYSLGFVLWTILRITTSVWNLIAAGLKIPFLVFLIQKGIVLASAPKKGAGKPTSKSRLI